MKDDNFKDIWNMISNQKEIPDFKRNSIDQNFTSWSGSIQSKTRKMLQNDLLLKTVSGLAFLLTLLLYRNTLPVIYICIAGLLFQAIMVTIEVNLMLQFNKVSDLGLATRDNLSGILTFLKRKSHLYEITIASTQIMFFVPGILLYFFIVYGQVKPMTLFDYFVFSVLALIGTIFSYLRVRSQLIFYVKHTTACLADLNEDTLEFVLKNIERQSKQDETIKVLVYLLLVVGFVALLAVLKAIVCLPL